MGGTESDTELDDDAAAQCVIDLVDELELLIELRDRFGVPALQRLEVAEPHPGADNQHALLARQGILLERNGAACGRFAPDEVTAEGEAVRKLQRLPADLRVSGASQLVP